MGGSPPSDLLGLVSLLGWTGTTGQVELKESHVHSQFLGRIKVKFLVKQIHIIIISKQIRARWSPTRAVTCLTLRVRPTAKDAAEWLMTTFPISGSHQYSLKATTGHTGLLMIEHFP